MKRAILSVLLIVCVLAFVAGTLILVDKLVYTPSDEIVSDFQSFDADDIDRIEIDVSTSFVNIFSSAVSGTVTIDLLQPKSDSYDIRREGGTLYIEEKKASWIDELVRVDSERYGISVGLPKELYASLVVNTDAGNVDIDGTSLMTLNLTGADGDISLSGVSSEQIRIYQDYGNIEIKSSEIKSLTAETDFGDIIIEKVTADSTALTSDFGNIDINSLDSDKIEVEADSGNVSVSGVITLDAAINVEFGNVTGSLVGSRDDYCVSATVEYGSCNLSSDVGKDGIRLAVHVESGDISLRFEN